jgi:hypothetical protein
MIALDTSSVIALFSGERGPDGDSVESAFLLRQGVLPPVVVYSWAIEPQVYRSGRL